MLKLSATLATAYNQDRALLQGLTILAVCAGSVLAAQEARWRWSSRLTVGSVAAALALTFAAISGLGGVTSPATAGINMANSGEDYERFYITIPELAAAHWLKDEKKPESLVYADGYASIPFLLATGEYRNVLQDVTPATLDAHGWVYLDRTNLIGAQARVSFNNHAVVYQYPQRYLDDQYDLVYSNGSSVIYHR
jgi:uncharacterized membrane protein